MDNVKEFSEESLFFQLLLFVLFLALSMYCVDRNLERMDINAVLSLNLFISQAIFNTLFSYFSDRVSDQAEEIGWFAYKTCWYKMPWKQRYFIQWIIRRAQKSFEFTGAKIVPSSLETMANVLISLSFTWYFSKLLGLQTSFSIWFSVDTCSNKRLSAISSV